MEDSPAYMRSTGMCIMVNEPCSRVWRLSCTQCDAQRKATERREHSQTTRACSTSPSTGTTAATFTRAASMERWIRPVLGRARGRESRMARSWYPRSKLISRRVHSGASTYRGPRAGSGMQTISMRSSGSSCPLRTSLRPSSSSVSAVLLSGRARVAHLQITQSRLDSTRLTAITSESAM